jgi:hypothetical protein
MRLALAMLAGLVLLITPTIAQGPPFPVFPKKEEPKKEKAESKDKKKGEKNRFGGRSGPYYGGGFGRREDDRDEGWRYLYRGPMVQRGGVWYRWDRRDDRYERVRSERP